MATALSALRALPTRILAPHPTPIDRLDRLRAALGPTAPELFMKRDDLLSFAMGGNKVRKLQTVLAQAAADGADTVITCGGVQSNHCRVTAAAGASLGLRVILVVNGPAPENPTGNALLDRLFGAEIHHVSSREARTETSETVARSLREDGRRPFVIPLGASTPTGALGFAKAVEELVHAGLSPDVIVHSTSSGGTQAGLTAGCALFGLKARIIGISADVPSQALTAIVRDLLEQMRSSIGASATAIGLDRDLVVDDQHVGDGYGIPTPGSIEAIERVARTEGIVLDPVYTAKAMAGLMALIRSRSISSDARVLFWHTGGQPGLFA